MRDAVSVARALIGKTLVSAAGEKTSGLIVEAEAYAGHGDAACHSYKHKGPSGDRRTNVMFGPGGYAYVYLIYGMYNCFNVVANAPGEPEAVLIRALAPRDGISVMRERRNLPEGCALKKICGGPGKLCAALGITRAHYGADLCDPNSPLFITEGEEIPEDSVLATPRINVDYAGDAALFPYRFVLRGSEFLSGRNVLNSGNERF